MRPSQQVHLGGLPFPPNSPLLPLHLGGPTQHGSWLHSLSQAPLPWQGVVPEGAGKPGMLQSSESQRVRQLGDCKTKTTTTITKLYITSREFIPLITESLYPSTDIYLCPPIPKPMATTFYSLLPWALCFQMPPINEIRQYLSFSGLFHLA